MNHEPLFTPEQVASQLKIHPKTVREWCRSGELLAYRVGAQWRIPESGLRAYLDSHRNQPQSDAHQQNVR